MSGSIVAPLLAEESVAKNSSADCMPVDALTGFWKADSDDMIKVLDGQVYSRKLAGTISLEGSDAELTLALGVSCRGHVSPECNQITWAHGHAWTRANMWFVSLEDHVGFSVMLHRESRPDLFPDLRVMGWGEVFEVSEEVGGTGLDGTTPVTYLKLADGRGWVAESSIVNSKLLCRRHVPRQSQSPKPPTTFWLQMAVSVVLHLGLQLTVVTAVSQKNGFAPCNDNPCLYYVLFPRQYQPSTSGQFYIVQNGHATNTTIASALPYSSSASVCAGEDVTSQIVDDLLGQPSMICLIIGMVVLEVVNAVHDVLLVAREGADTILVGRLTVVSFLLSNALAVLAIFWGMSLAETFVAPVPASYGGHGVCFYAMPTVQVLVGLSSVFALVARPFIRLPNTLRALTFGEYLFHFDNYKVPFNIVQQQVHGGLMQDPSSSMIAPGLVGSASTATGHAGVLDVCSSYFGMPQVAPPYGRELITVTSRNTAFIVWVCLVPRVLNLGYLVIDVACMALATALLVKDWRYPMKSSMCKYICALPLSFTPLRKRHAVCGVPMQHMVLMLGPPIQRLCLLATWMTTIVFGFLGSPIFARGMLEVVRFVRFLGSGVPSSDGAKSLASDCRMIVIIGLMAYQAYIVENFNKFLVSRIGDKVKV